MSSNKRISHVELKNFVLQLLGKVGALNGQSRVFAEALVWSDLIGRPTHGVWRLPSYLRRIEEKLINCPCRPRLHAGGPAVALLDGDEGLGHYVGHRAMLVAIDRAAEFGIGAVGVYNSNHFGTAAWFVQQAARRNMIGLAFSNSLAKVAAHGGVRAVFGTNPFAFAVPRRHGDSLLLDMATAASSGSQVMKYAEAGMPLPEGIAVDGEGRPIRDPDAVGKGALLAFGGAKGYGLALMVEILSAALTGAMFSTGINSMFTNFSESGKNGHFFLAIDVARFMEPALFLERLESLLETVRGSGRPGESVLIPGEMRWRHYHENLQRGVPLDDATVDALESLAHDHRVPGLFVRSWRGSAPAAAGVALHRNA